MACLEALGKRRHFRPRWFSTTNAFRAQGKRGASNLGDLGYILLFATEASNQIYILYQLGLTLIMNPLAAMFGIYPSFVEFVCRREKAIQGTHLLQVLINRFRLPQENHVFATSPIRVCLFEGFQLVLPLGFPSTPTKRGFPKPWFTWWFNHLPGPSISPKRTPMKEPFARIQRFLLLVYL